MVARMESSSSKNGFSFAIFFGVSWGLLDKQTGVEVLLRSIDHEFATEVLVGVIIVFVECSATIGNELRQEGLAKLCMSAKIWSEKCECRIF
eukprot:scaffold337_cov172-Amphora_coffeaeformis.AAC.20